MVSHVVDQAGRWEPACTDCDCFAPDIHPASGPHRFAGDPPAETVTEELVRRIAASLARHPERDPLDAARNVVSWIAIDYIVTRRISHARR